MDIIPQGFTKYDLACSFVGGIMIGVATSLNFAVTGRPTGNSGVFNTLIKFDASSGLRWKFWFFVGLIYSSFILNLISKDGVSELFGFEITVSDPKATRGEGVSLNGWLIGGFLVGVGTKLGNGCTSGHGVCGLPRFSKRSLAAVITFMTSCAIVATYRDKNPFFDESFFPEHLESYNMFAKFVPHFFFIAFVLFYLISIVKVDEEKALIEMPLSFVVGIIFGIGLSVSGMCRRSKVYGFFTINESWDPSLAFVMGGAVLFNLVTFEYILNRRKSTLLSEYFELTKFPTVIDAKLVSGAAIFGAGWGITGMCPGPAMINLFNFPQAVVFLLMVAAGQLTIDLFEYLTKSNKAAASPKKQKKD